MDVPVVHSAISLMTGKEVTAIFTIINSVGGGGGSPKHPISVELNKSTFDILPLKGLYLSTPNDDM